MKLFTLVGVAGSLGLLAAGCGHLDMTPPGSADRVLNAMVTNNTESELPPDTEVMVRVVDLSRGESRGEVLAEETVKNPGRMPVAVRVEYRADDATLRRSVNVEARVSVGGRLRYMTTSAHPITPGNADDTHVIEVSLVAKR